MICIKCGHPNPEGVNYCEKCNQHMLKMVPQGAAATSSMIVEEGYTYLAPTRMYPTQYLYDLTCRAKEYLEDSAPGEPLLEAFQVVKARIGEFETESLPTIMEGLKSINTDFPRDDYPKQMAYLLNKGTSVYKEGIVLFESFITSGSNEELVSGITKMQEGNDYLGVALEFCGKMGELLEDILEVVNRRIAMKASGKDPDADEEKSAAAIEEKASADPG